VGELTYGAEVRDCCSRNMSRPVIGRPVVPLLTCVRELGEQVREETPADIARSSDAHLHRRTGEIRGHAPVDAARPLIATPKLACQP
jgi:hypothetical protein